MNTDDRYAVEEREKQIAVLHELKRARRRERQERPPDSLLKALHEQNVLSAVDLKALSEAEYKNPVVSLYIQLSPEKVAPAENALVRSFHSLKSRALEQRKDFIDTLAWPQRELLTHD